MQMQLVCVTGLGRTVVQHTLCSWHTDYRLQVVCVTGLGRTVVQHTLCSWHTDCSYWFGEDRVGGDSKSGDHMLLHKGQSSREVLSEPSQVHLRLLVV